MKLAGALEPSCIYIMTDFFYLSYSIDEIYPISDLIIALGNRSKSRGGFFSANSGLSA